MTMTQTIAEATTTPKTEAIPTPRTPRTKRVSEQTPEQAATEKKLVAIYTGKDKDGKVITSLLNAIQEFSGQVSGACRVARQAWSGDGKSGKPNPLAKAFIAIKKTVKTADGKVEEKDAKQEVSASYVVRETAITLNSVLRKHEAKELTSGEVVTLLGKLLPTLGDFVTYDAKRMLNANIGGISKMETRLAEEKEQTGELEKQLATVEKLFTGK